MGGYPSSTFSAPLSSQSSSSESLLPSKQPEKKLREEDKVAKRDMPPVFIEKKRRRGTAGKRRSLDKVPESAYWPGLEPNEASQHAGEKPNHPSKPSTESSSTSTEMEVSNSSSTKEITTADTMERVAMPQTSIIPPTELTASKSSPNSEAPSWKIMPFQKPRCRSRKRKKVEDTTWKEIMSPNDCDNLNKKQTINNDDRDGKLQEKKGQDSKDFAASLPEDLQIAQTSEKRQKLESSTMAEPTAASTDFLTPSPDVQSMDTAASARVQEQEVYALASSIAPKSVNDVLRQLPPVAGMITQMYRMLCKSFGSSPLVLPSSSEPDEGTKSKVGTGVLRENQRLSQLCQRQEEVVSRLELMEQARAEKSGQNQPELEQVIVRLESIMQRQEKFHSETIAKMVAKVQTLEEENQGQRAQLQMADSFEASLKQTKGSLVETSARLEKVQNKLRKQDAILQEERTSREAERKENHNRVAEALQQIEQLRQENQRLRQHSDPRHAAGKTRSQSASHAATTQSHAKSLDKKRTIIGKTRAASQSGESPRRKPLSAAARLLFNGNDEDEIDDRAGSYSSPQKVVKKQQYAALETDADTPTGAGHTRPISKRSKASRNNASFERETADNALSTKKSSGAGTKKKTPRQAFEEDLEDEGFSSEKSDDSPFSLSGTNSRRSSMFSRRRRIVPGSTLVGAIAPEVISSNSVHATNRQGPTSGKGTLFPPASTGRRNRFLRSSIRDLVPDYCVDSLQSLRRGGTVPGRPNVKDHLSVERNIKNGDLCI